MHVATFNPSSLVDLTRDEPMNKALAKGYTRAVLAESDFHSIELLVKPDVDFDDQFTAWDVVKGEWLIINGWNFTFEEA